MVLKGGVMRWRRYVVGAICLALVGCGVETQLKKRTLVGISAQQTLIDAQHALAEEGLDIEEIDFDEGVIKSSWETRNRRQIQYVIQVSTLNMAKTAPGATPAGADAGVASAAPDTTAVRNPSVVDITVTTLEKEKTVGGWTTPKTSRSARAGRLLDDIIELSIGRFSGPSKEVPVSADKTQICGSTVECPAGMHCGSGECVQECLVGSDCGQGSLCDERGRCILQVDPCSEPTPVNESEGELQAETVRSSTSARKGENDDK